MEVEGQITLDEWMQWKEDIRRKLKETAGNFVYIGCRLRQIRDSGMLDGAADIFEFAQREYGLSKSTTSRFIAVNERFADPYNPLLIKEEFENIGSSKLSEMLTLPDSECALITEKTTVKEIRDLKSFDKEAEKLENVEKSMDTAVATSQQDAGLVPETEPDYTSLQRCIIDYFAEKQIMLDKALGQIREQQWKEAFETVNPSGYASSRKGLCFLFMYEWSRGVAYKLMTEPAPVNMNWEDFLKDVAEIYGQQSWEEFYRKQKEEPEAAQEKTEVPQGEMQEEPEQQLPGQMEIKDTDMNMEEYQTPHPEGITSLCYSCAEYETCNVKTGTCTKCDRYKSRKEAHKTDEQRYAEEQDRIDRETKKKLQEKTDAEKMEHLPSESRITHDLKIGKTFFEDVVSGRKKFELRKNDRNFREGDGIVLHEMDNGQPTGQTAEVEIIYMLQDYTGLEEGYCILGIELVER